MDTVGIRAEEIRKADAYRMCETEGMSKTAAAAVIGVCRKTITRWLKGPGLEQCRRYYEALSAGNLEVEVEEPAAPPPPEAAILPFKRAEGPALEPTADLIPLEQLAILLDSLMKACSLADACARARVDFGQVTKWLKLAEEGDASAICLAEDIRAAEAECRVRLLVALAKGGTGWGALAWILERRWPEEFGKRDPKRDQAVNPAEGLGPEELLTIIARGIPREELLKALPS